MITKLQIVYKTYDFTLDKEIYKKASIPFNEDTMMYDGRMSFRDNVDEFIAGTMNKGVIFLDDDTAISVLSIISFSKSEEHDNAQPPKNNPVQNQAQQNPNNQNHQNNQNRKHFKKRFGRRQDNFQPKPTQEVQTTGPTVEPAIVQPIVNTTAEANAYVDVLKEVNKNLDTVIDSANNENKI